MGLSIWHILLFAFVVILLFGTSKLKNLGKDLGGALKDFKDTMQTDESLKAQEKDQKIHDVKDVSQDKASKQDVS